MIERAMGTEFLLALLFGIAFIAACASYGRYRHDQKNKDQ